MLPAFTVLWWTYAGASTLLVGVAALMSGLMSLISQSSMELQIDLVGGNTKERQNAGRLLPIYQRYHRVLSALVAFNTVAMTASTTFLDKIASTPIAILISTTVFVLVVEVIPQAMFRRHGAGLGARFVPLMNGLMYICFPLCWTLGKALDYFIGHNDGFLTRRKLKAFLDLQSNVAGKGGNLTLKETKVMKGAMCLREQDLCQKGKSRKRSWATDCSATPNTCVGGLLNLSTTYAATMTHNS